MLVSLKLWCFWNILIQCKLEAQFILIVYHESRLNHIAYRKNGASTNKSLSADPYDIPLQFPVVVEDDAKIG